MRRRLYFLLPDLESARRTSQDLLLARVGVCLAVARTDVGRLRMELHAHGVTSCDRNTAASADRERG